MKVDGSLKLVSQLLDMPIVDQDGRWCGIVDDVEFSGGPGKEARLSALLVGPGAYEGRMPGWLYQMIRKVVGDRLVRVSVKEIFDIGAVLKLACPASKLGLGRSEDRVRRWIPRWGAM